jgi:hypothetical protein
MTIASQSPSFVLERLLIVASGDEDFYLPPAWQRLAAFPFFEYQECLGVISDADRNPVVVTGAGEPFNLSVGEEYDIRDFFRDLPSARVLTEKGPEDSMTSGSVDLVAITSEDQFPQLTNEVLSALRCLEADLARVVALADAIPPRPKRKRRSARR